MSPGRSKRLTIPQASHLLLCRFADTGSDTDLNIAGGGLRQMPSEDNHWYLAGTLDTRLGDARDGVLLTLLDRFGEVVLDKNEEPISHQTGKDEDDEPDEKRKRVMVRQNIVVRLPIVSQPPGLYMWQVECGSVQARLPFMIVGSTGSRDEDVQSPEFVLAE